MNNNICKHTEGYDCLDDAMILAFEKYNINYNFVFIKSWCFNFDNSLDTLGQALNGNRGDRFEIINKIFNVNFECYSLQNKYDVYPLGNYLKIKSTTNIEKLTNKLKKVMNSPNKELIVQYDAFYSPWDDLFNKFHGTHMCYINSIIDEEVELFDSWYSTIKRVNIKDLLDMSFKFIILDFSNASSVLEKVNDVIVSIKENTDFNRLEKSINCFKENLDLLDLNNEFKECTKFDYTKAPIMRNMKESIYNEMQLSILFNDLYKLKQDDEFKEISKLFEENSKRIELLRMYIAKEFLTNSVKYSNDIKRIATDIKDNDIFLINKFKKI